MRTHIHRLLLRKETRCPFSFFPSLLPQPAPLSEWLIIYTSCNYAFPIRQDLLAACKGVFIASFRLIYFFFSAQLLLLFLLRILLFFRLGGRFLGLLLYFLLLYLYHKMAFYPMPGEPALLLVRFLAIPGI